MFCLSWCSLGLDLVTNRQRILIEIDSMTMHCDDAGGVIIFRGKEKNCFYFL